MMLVRYTLVRVDVAPVSSEPKAEMVGMLRFDPEREEVVSVGSRRTGGGDPYLEVVLAERLPQAADAS